MCYCACALLYYSTIVLLRGLYFCTLYYFFFYTSVTRYWYKFFCKLHSASAAFNYFFVCNSLRSPIQWSLIMSLRPGCSGSYCSFINEYVLFSFFLFDSCIFRASIFIDYPFFFYIFIALICRSIVITWYLSFDIILKFETVINISIFVFKMRIYY